MHKISKLYYILLINGLVFVAVILLAIGGSRAVTTIAENTPVAGRKTLIIDAGHGGVDGGATSCSGVLESQYNLEIALRLKDLCHLLGMKTLMIRKTDCSVYTEGGSIAAKKVSDLKNRVALINGTDDAALISIHQNYYPDSRYSGAQVFYGKHHDSESIAKALQKALIETVNIGSRRQSKKATGIYLMQHVEQPGVLLECGFLSNPEEDAKLQDDMYQKKLCAVIASVFSMYLY